MDRRQTLLVELAYDGSAFHGVARQPGYATVSETLEHHLTEVFGVTPRGLAFAARTDRGVSALQNFATCWFRDIDGSAERLSRLKAQLPNLQVRGGTWVGRQVNARNSTEEKHYRYHIRAGLPQAELTTGPGGHAWTIAPQLDVARMQRAAGAFVGTHDYSAFRASGCEGRDPIKTLGAVSVTSDGADIVIDVVGRAFLRKMVRILVGTLAEVGAGLRSVESVSALLETGDRQISGLTAPAHGLCLVSVQLAGVPTR